MKTLKHLGIVVLCTIMFAGVLAGCKEQTTPKKDIGLQVYSLRDGMKADPVATLKAIADMGYKNLELAGYSNGKFYNMEPADFRKLVEDLGMKITSSHLGKSLDKEKYAETMAWWGQAIEAHNALGVSYMIQPSPPIRLEDATTADLDAMIAYLEDVGVNCNSAGIRFGYHNHKKEFLTINDTVIYDYLIQNSDPTRVCYELDVYWAQEGGANPVELINKYADRIPLLHIKDDKEIGASGKMDFKTIYDAAYANGNLKGYFVEQEAYTGDDQLASVKQSFDYLNTAEYVK